MAISSALKAFLTQQNVAFTARRHPLAYTAQEIAAKQHVSGKQLAKCVVVKTDLGLRLAVLPAALRVDFAKLKTLLKAKRVTLASEPEIKRAFPDVEVGAMSPFGNLYNVPVVSEKVLADSPELVCNAGSHTETITLRYADFARLAAPRIGSFGMAVIAKPAKKTTKKSSAAKKKPPTKKKAASRAAKKKRSTARR